VTARIINLRRRRVRKARAVVKVKTLHRLDAELHLARALQACRQMQRELNLARQTLAALKQRRAS
jgi:hypothetical protein